MLENTLSHYRASIEKELAALLAEAAPARLCAEEISGIRQFLGWHRLSYHEDLPLDDVPGRLARFIVERSAARGSGEPQAGEVEQVLLAADLLQQSGSVSIRTLRRRIAALSRVVGRDEPGLHHHPSVQQALRIAAQAERQRNARPVPDGCPVPDDVRARLLATCDGSITGVRDCALLRAWFATGMSLAALLRLDQQALLGSIDGCPDARNRSMAALAVRQWCERAQIPGGPVFRRVWSSDRIGAPMSVEAANRMLRRRLALPAATAVAHG